MADRRRAATMPTLAFRGETYPRRGQFFANKFGRLLLKTCAAREVGCEGLGILMMVVFAEDSTRYRRPVRFWNAEFEDRLNLTYKKFNSARKRLIAGGWLHYEEGDKEHPGVYWCTIPPCFDDFDDCFLGENTATGQGTPDTLPNSLSKGEETDQQREIERRDKGSAFIPIPNSNSPAPVPADAGPAAAERILLRLKRCGVDKNVETLDEALANGLTLDDVGEAIDYFESRPKAWGPGALRLRLVSRSARFHAPHEGWGPPALAERESELQKRRAEDTVAAQKTREEATGRSAERKQLELDFGKQLDDLPEDTVAGLLSELQLDPAFVRRTSPGGRMARHPVVRPQLLRALAVRHGQQN